jgi:membrane fusion protein, multidrug efflux system
MKSLERVLASLHSSLFSRRWTLAVILIAVAFGGYLGWIYVHKSRAGAAVSGKANGSDNLSAIPVTVAQVKTADFPVYLHGLGTVQPYVTVTVRSRVDGEVTKVAFKQGQMVKEGDLLVQIDPRPYQAALDQALAKKAQDEANLKNAQLDLRRYTSLANENSIARQQLDTQQATVDQLIAQIKGDEAAIENAQTQLSYTTIRSPLAGKVGFRLVDPGNIVHAADTTGIVTIVKLQPISVVFTAPEECARDKQSARHGCCTGNRAEFGRVDNAVGGPARPRQQRGRPGERHNPNEGDVRDHRQCSVARPLGLDPPIDRHIEASNRRP